MKKEGTHILKATARERRLIAALTAKPVFKRLDAGELEIVSPDDWSDVPELEDVRMVAVPKPLYRKLQATSRKRHTSPDRLAARILAGNLDT